MKVNTEIVECQEGRGAYNTTSITCLVIIVLNRSLVSCTFGSIVSEDVDEKEEIRTRIAAGNRMKSWKAG